MPFINGVATMRDTLRDLVAGGKTCRYLSSGDADTSLLNDPLFDYKLFGAVTMITIAQSAQHIFRYDTAVRFVCIRILWAPIALHIADAGKPVCKI